MRYHESTQTWSGSATDLANHARCGYLTQLQRDHSREVASGRAQRVEAAGLVVEKGREHEAAVVAVLRAEVEAAGGEFVDVVAAAGDDIARRRDILADAMQRGVALIAQAPLRAGSVMGYADLLERQDDGSYEPVEIKFARSVKPEYLLQVCAYADALGAMRDGELPRRVHVIDGRSERHTFQTSEYIEYYRASSARFAEALALDLQEQLAQVPEPVPFCAQCEFADICKAKWAEVDHLSLVANIRATQRAKLGASGITTLAGLADSDIDRVSGIGRSTLQTLKTQARLQDAARTSGSIPVEYRSPAADELPGRGFALLPDPDAHDMFFDFEGYPYHDAGGLEYLWGWTSAGADGAPRFDYLWASDPVEEAAAFSSFLDDVHERFARSPGMHVYHYAPYEITALRRLAKVHQHEMDRLDVLLRAGVFIDLYAVVRQSMLVGTPSYSIKKLEPLYGVTREGDEVADGGASIEVFEQWLLTRDEHTKQSIIDYNQVDCDSTLALRDWLLGHRDAARAQGIEWPADVSHENEDEEQAASETDTGPSEIAQLVARLEAVAGDEERAGDIRQVARLLSAMPGWDRRIKREFFGELYARMRDRDADDYLDEPSAIGGLQFIGSEPVKRSMGYHYSFPEQTMTVSQGSRALDAETVTDYGTIHELNLDDCVVTLKLGPTLLAKEPRHPNAIIGWTNISVESLERVACTVAEQFLATLDVGGDPFAPDAAHAAVLSILAGHHTRAVSGAGPEAIEAPPTPEALAELVQRIDGSHLIVQGPPGTGKTWTSARMIVALINAGLRVGISSNSHAAVINVLRGIDEIKDHGIRAAYPLSSKESKPDGDLDFGSQWLTRAGSSAQACDLMRDGDVQLIAGTAWLFAKEPPIDVMLIDEAGQVSLLHATAMGAQARAVVLVGDPQQLPQPSSAKHPAGLEASVLEHLFGEESVLPSERAVLLPITRRMHPDVAQFISETYYRGELHAFETTSEQYVDAPGLPRTGIHVASVEHSGNRVRSDEEVVVIKQIVVDLLTSGRVVPKPGEAEREMRAEDIIIVAPYNAQRRALQEVLGPDIEVGTVDSFQGQEAPVAILSMTASSRDELPRGLDFLLDPHRLNVAISRARALAIVVCSPSLAATSAKNLHEMRLLNDVARLVGGHRTCVPPVDPSE